VTVTGSTYRGFVLQGRRLTSPGVSHAIGHFVLPSTIVSSYSPLSIKDEPFRLIGCGKESVDDVNTLITWYPKEVVNKAFLWIPSRQEHMERIQLVSVSHLYIAGIR